MKGLRILLADDHPVVRAGLVAILGTQPDFEVVGEAATGREVLERVAALRPDVLLLDLEMPESDGVTVLERLREAASPTRTIVFTVFDSDERILGAVRAGAQGYLLKGAPREEIFRAVRVVSAGGSLLQPIVASRVLRSLQSGRDSREAAPDLLTAREREVLALLARGKTNKEIAAALGVAERTVKFHVGAILGKLGASNRTEAVTLAAGRGLVSL